MQTEMSQFTVSVEYSGCIELPTSDIVLGLSECVGDIAGVQSAEVRDLDIDVGASRFTVSTELAADSLADARSVAKQMADCVNGKHFGCSIDSSFIQGRASVHNVKVLKEEDQTFQLDLWWRADLDDMVDDTLHTCRDLLEEAWLKNLPDLAVGQHEHDHVATSVTAELCATAIANGIDEARALAAQAVAALNKKTLFVSGNAWMEDSKAKVLDVRYRDPQQWPPDVAMRESGATMLLPPDPDPL